MDCKRCESMIPAYLQGELSDTEVLELEEYLENCENCRTQLKETQMLLKQLDGLEDKEPSVLSRNELLSKLEEEKAHLRAVPLKPAWNKSFLRIAASVIIFLLGLGVGQFDFSGSQGKTELSELRTEVSEMKQLVMMSMLKEVSASERIKAVSYVKQFEQPSEEVIHTLFRTLNEDESPNVRMAALEGLRKFADNEQIRLRLIRSFEVQSDPVIQIMMINLMVELEEKRAIKKFQNLIDHESTQKIVRDQAEMGIQLLI